MTTGIVMNIIGGLIVLLVSTTWMMPVFDLNHVFITNLTIANATVANVI